MDSYSSLLEKLRVPQPSMQRFAVISIFEKLRSAPPHLGLESEPGKQALSQCLYSNETAAVDQTVRELCFLVKQGKMKPDYGIMELQAALESCNSRFVEVIVKGIGFLCRFAFKNNQSWSLHAPELHPFIKVLSCRAEAQAELVQQVISFIVQNKHMEFTDTSKFLRPFLMFAVLIVPPSSASSFFSRHLMPSMASLSCSLPPQGLHIFKILVECLNYFPRRNLDILFAVKTEAGNAVRMNLRNCMTGVVMSATLSSCIKSLCDDLVAIQKSGSNDCKLEFTCLISSAEYLVGTFAIILQQMVGTEMLLDEAQVCGVDLLETILSFCIDIHENSCSIELVIELSKRLLIAQKEFGLRYVPEFHSVVASLAIILTRAEFEHEQLLILKLSVFLLKWKNEEASLAIILTREEFEQEQLLILKLPVFLLKWNNEEEPYIMGRAAGCLSEELLFVFPVIHLMSSPSKSIKAAAADLLFILEKLVVYLLVAPDYVPTPQTRYPSIGKPESIVLDLLHCIWFQDQSSVTNSYLLRLSCNGKSGFRWSSGNSTLWLAQLKECSLITGQQQKSTLISQSQENLITGVPLLLSTVLTVLVAHRTLGSFAVDSLAGIGSMDPRLGVSLLLSVLFYIKIFCSCENNSHEILLKLLAMLPSLASHSAMAPLVVQTILPMLHKDAKPILYATAVRLLSKTWEVTDRIFGSLQPTLHPKAFTDFVRETNVCISLAASVYDVSRENPDRGVDLILSVSACIESRVPTIQALGFQSLGHLCEADVVDFYTAWNVISKHVLDYSVDPVVAHGLCYLLRWGAMDAQAYPEASRSILQILWEIGTSRHSGHACMWVKAQAIAFEALTHYEVELVRQSIPDFMRRNVHWLISEANPVLLRAVEAFEIKIITFEHSTRRRLLKEKRVLVNKVEKLLDVFPQVLFSSGKGNKDATELPGAALLCNSFTPKDMQGKVRLKEFLKLQALYESALTGIAESLKLSRNILVALLSLQSWKPFMQRWVRETVMLLDEKGSFEGRDKNSKAADDILKSICKIAERSIPRSAENIALAVGALSMVLPPSAHAVTKTASEFLLNWLFQYEHEYKQWSAAISLGLVSSCLHTTDWEQKFQIINGLLKVACNSKSILVKGACGVGLGFTCEGLLTRVEVSDDSNLEQGTIRLKEATLLGKIVRTLSLMVCQLCPSTSDSLENLCRFFPLGTGGLHTEEETTNLSCNGCAISEEDVWGIAGLVMGLGNSLNSIYRAGAHDIVSQIKHTVIAWIPHVNSCVADPCIYSEASEIPLSVGSCLALPTIVAICQRAELMDEDLDCLLNGYIALISELLAIKKSGLLHQSLLMASCVGAGNLLSCILNEGVHPIKAEDVKKLLDLMRNTYIQAYPPSVHLGAMLGVVNALGAGAGILTQMYHQPSSLQMDLEQKESSYIRRPILSTPICEPTTTSLMQEMFLIAQNSKDQQMTRHAAWAVAFLRHRWWSREPIAMNGSQSKSSDSKPVSQSFAENSMVWQLCSWLMDLNGCKAGTIYHVDKISSVLRCLSQAPRLPAFEWGAIIRCCMRYEDQDSSRIQFDPALAKGTLREECINFSFAHANRVNPLLCFLDELVDLARFQTLEHNLQSLLLDHLVDIMNIFSDSRTEKLYNHLFEYFRSSSTSYSAYNPDQRSLLRTSFWKGVCKCLTEASPDSINYIASMEKCMKLLFILLPMLAVHDESGVDPGRSEQEWSEAVRCLGKAQKGWLMDMLQVPEMGAPQGESPFNESVKRIFARARLVMIDCMPMSELEKLKHYILNTESNGIWGVLVEVAAAIQWAEVSVRRQWLLDVVEICCIAKYPSTAFRFLGILSGSWSKYAPLLIVDPTAVLSNLPVTLPSLLSDCSWRPLADSVVHNLWVSTERVYAWTTRLTSGEDFNGPDDIDASENSMSVFLTRVLHRVCVALIDYLPFEKQLQLATMVIP